MNRTAIDVFNEAHWRYLFNSYKVTKHKYSLRIGGWWLLKYDIEHIDRVVRYFYIGDNPSEDLLNVGSYLCGLIGRLWSNDSLFLVGEKRYIMPSNLYYSKGWQAEKSGYEGLDNYTHYLRKLILKYVRKGLNRRIGQPLE